MIFIILLIALFIMMVLFLWSACVISSRCSDLEKEEINFEEKK